MIIICGKTIAEVERDLELAKQAIASGAKVGIGGATLADAEKAMEMLHSAVGGEVAITNPNYVPPVEDEDEICPNCGEWWDGYYCENCGYDPDNEDECCDCDECDCECGHSCCKCEDEEEEVDPASAFIQWLEQMNAPLDIISVAKGMFQ